MSTLQWTGQGLFIVRNEHYTVKSIRYIYGMKWALHSEQCKVNILYKMSTTQWAM